MKKKGTPNKSNDATKFFKKKIKKTPHVSNPKKKASEEIRLNKFIANSGMCSRRDADIYITSGNVSVNGKVIFEMGYKVKLTDTVKFDKKIITPEKKVYVLLNKPKGLATNTTGMPGRKSVLDLVANASKLALVPVGRLDRNTSGLLLFTNDGFMVKKLTEARTLVRKLYHVELNKNLKTKDIETLKKGLKIDGLELIIDKVSYIDNAPKREVGIEIRSGRSSVVRKIFNHLGYDILKLDRVIFGELTKKNLPRGHWRYLNVQEVNNLNMISCRH